MRGFVVPKAILARRILQIYAFSVPCQTVFAGGVAVALQRGRVLLRSETAIVLIWLDVASGRAGGPMTVPLTGRPYAYATESTSQYENCTVSKGRVLMSRRSVTGAPAEALPQDRGVTVEAGEDHLMSRCSLLRILVTILTNFSGLRVWREYRCQQFLGGIL